METALAAGGQIVSGLAGYQAGKYNNKVAKINARNIENEGLEEATRIRGAGRVMAGAQIAAQGESGFEIGQGSAIDTLLESQTASELAALDAWRQARATAAGYRAQGLLARQQGKFAMIQGVMGAAKEVAGAVGDYAAAGAGG